MDWLFWSHSNCANRERFLRGNLRFTRIASGDVWDNNMDIAFITESPCIYGWNIQAYSNPIDIVSKSPNMLPGLDIV